MDEFALLMDGAQAVYRENFPMKTSFERAIFFSWGCTLGDCTFCYMSTQPENKKPRETKRTTESILAEVILAKQLGWDIGFFTGGIGVLTASELEFLLKSMYEITGEKTWLSVGPVPKATLERYLPYIKGVVGSTETINPVLHKKVCPSKPLAPYEKMFLDAKELGLQRAMTFIVGMGETHDDFQLLQDFIVRYDIQKIHVYGLIPQEGTMFTDAPVPTKEEQAWWISQMRIAFPKLDIQCGIWEDRVERVGFLLNAGANSLSKFRATRLFGTPIAKAIEEQSASVGRKFYGTLTQFPDVDWDVLVDGYSFDVGLKERIKKKLRSDYVSKMSGGLVIAQS